jgi:hypothetical protein
MDDNACTSLPLPSTEAFVAIHPSEGSWTYVYFLNGPGSIHISCGFHPSTFESIFAIRSNEREILQNKIDWFKLYLNLEEKNHSNYKINENLSLHIGPNFVTFETKEVKIVLSKDEWELFEKLLHLFHKYMIYYF